MEAYPEAKFILSLKEEEEWYDSMKNDQGSSEETSSTKPLVEKCHQVLWQNDFAKNGKQAYKEHSEGVYKSILPTGRAVAMYQVKMGWGPLCQHLEKDVPEKEFPEVNDWAEYEKKYGTES